MSRRLKVRDTDIQHEGMFAVMRHTRELTSARFVVLHKTEEAARDAASDMAARHVALNGPSQEFCFYIVKIVGRIGIIDGKLHS